MERTRICVRGQFPRAFLLLVLAQAAHSVEEFVTRLYEVFGPATFVSGLVSADLASGFVTVNAAVVLFGVSCWAVPVRRGWPSAPLVGWGWAVVELANGCGHLLLSLSHGGYFPGVLTATLLLAAGARLVLVLGAEACSARATAPH